MEFFTNILGRNGIIMLIGMVIFYYSFKYSLNIFEWIENQTFGTRNYILEKFELLFIEFDEQKLTYILLFISVGLGMIVLLIFALLGKWFLGLTMAIAVSFIGFKIPKPIINKMIDKRIKAYQGQMVDAMTLLANGIRAGLSLPQSLGMVVNEMPPPVSQEFNLILQQNRIGVPLEECFENLSKRIPIEDNEMFVSAINILRETGGNLAEVFDTIVDVIRERVRLQQKIDTFTAQGRFQGMTIAAMPFFIGGVYALSDPKSMVPMFTTPLGIIMTIVALGFDIIGFMVILKVVKIEV